MLFEAILPNDFELGQAVLISGYLSTDSIRGKQP